MSSGETNVSMPTGAYALNEVQNLTLLEVAYRAIQNGSKTESELKDILCVEDDTVELITKGFRIFNLGGKSEFEYTLTPLAFDAVDFNLQFRLHILNSVAAECSPQQWGLQSSVLLNLEYLLKEGTNRFVQTDEGLIRKIDNWHVDVGYEPQSQKGRMKLNSTKFSHWTNQAEYLGLIRGYKSGRRSAFIVRFDPNLIERTITLAAEEVGESDGVGFSEYLEWLEDNCLRIPTSSENALPAPFARTLYELVSDGKLKVTKRGDPSGFELPGIPSHSGISKAKNYLRIT
ncbi:hypothetical protein [Natronosalvus rutilus]|uniref:Uncharacterized protein n=1 Tax=Natronosalvus rutilus TaxID=2953753 RepID=A0A9E7SWK0_9EURY|nr:hypothetical protein [Natronosalvus rutilus]UTF55585.1 hypothetical protein NGM29_19465 [Natronosalvus rutilus]